jgi:hypothetical protein
MTPGTQPRRPSQSPAAPGPSVPDSAKRRLQRSSDDEARVAAESSESDAKQSEPLDEKQPEPRALSSYSEYDWDAPTIPDGKCLEAWDIDERG